MSNLKVPKTRTSKTGSAFLYTALGFFLVGLVLLLMTALSPYSWLSIVPVLLAIFCGLIALILGIVGVILKLVGRSPAEQLTEEQKAERTKLTQRNFGIFAAISGLVAAVLFMSFVAPIDVVNAKYHSLDKIKASTPDGFDFDSEFDEPVSIRFCNNLNPAAYCSTDAWTRGIASTPHPPAEYCKLIFDWVSKNQATTWINDFKGFDFNKDDPIAMMACVTGNMREIVGKSGKYQWDLTIDVFGNPGYHTLTTAIQDLGANTNYDAYVADISTTDPVQEAVFSALNHIGAWRKAHPDATVTEKNIRESIKGVGLKKVQVFTQKNKSVYLAYASQADPNQTMCVAVSKFDEKFFGVKDPGHGYFAVYNETPATIGQFGFFSQSACGQD